MVELTIPGRHQSENLLAAAAAASAFGVEAAQVAAAATELQPPEHRGRLMNLGDDISLVDDSYNASPVAVRRLLELLARAPGRRVAVLGEMYELGELAEEAHFHAGEQAATACDLLIAVGRADAAKIAQRARESGLPDGLVHHVADADSATELLRGVLRPGDVVLIKGSRGVGLDRTVKALAGGGAA